MIQPFIILPSLLSGQNSNGASYILAYSEKLNTDVAAVQGYSKNLASKSETTFPNSLATETTKKDFFDSNMAEMLAELQ